jgi:RNA polymerase sigma-70 factor (ECF subfamily)
MLEEAVDLTTATGADDEELVRGLRAGDEEAFMAVVRRYNALMLHVALGYVRTQAVAEDVVQETWCAVLAGIDGFEGRATLKTWIMRILANRAKTRGQREARCVPFSSLGGQEDDDGSAVDADRFLPADHPRYPGGWSAAPATWSHVPDERLLAAEVRDQIRAAVAELPARQRAVIALRDIEGWSPEEVCDRLDLSEGNQRVLLHRARSHVRADLERYFSDDCHTHAAKRAA